jgi:hypothetical protein
VSVLGEELPLLDYDTIPIGVPLGPITYTVTQEKVSAFREAVDDPNAQYITIGAKEYVNLLRTKYRLPTLVNAGHAAWYFHPPSTEAVITVHGHVVAKYKRGERAFVVTACTARDETGRVLSRTETTLRLTDFRSGQPAASEAERGGQ